MCIVEQTQQQDGILVLFNILRDYLHIPRHTSGSQHVTIALLPTPTQGMCKENNWKWRMLTLCNILHCNYVSTSAHSPRTLLPCFVVALKLLTLSLFSPCPPHSGWLVGLSNSSIGRRRELTSQPWGGRWEVALLLSWLRRLFNVLLVELLLIPFLLFFLYLLICLFSSTWINNILLICKEKCTYQYMIM